MPYERMLVPLDGSDIAEVAIPYAVEIAARSGAEILMVSISEDLVEQSHLSHLYQSYIERTVARVKQDLRVQGGRNSTAKGRLLTGRPADEILRVAAEENASLIIIASHGHSGRGPLPLGGIASKILQAATRPVLLVKKPATQTVSHPGLIKKILLPLDTSRAGEAAVPYAAELARLLGASIVLLHVEPEPVPWLVAPGVEFAYVPPVLPEQRAKRLSSHMDYLDKVASSLKMEGLATSQQAAAGAPGTEIVRYATDNQVDLIALSTHGASGVTRFVYGSITEHVLHACDLPVLLVRPAR